MATNKLERVTVYGLASSEDGRIRYIGQTTRPLTTRLAWHITWATRLRDDSRRVRWINSVLRGGHKLQIVELEVNAVIHEAEMRLIAEYKANGFDLVNTTAGGDQCIGVPKTAEHRAKIAAALKGRPSPWTAERNRQSKGKPGHPSTPETNAKISAAHKGKSKPWLAERNRNVEWTPERRKRLSESRTGQKPSDEHRARLSEVRKGRPWSEARRKAHEAGKAKK